MARTNTELYDSTYDLLAPVKLLHVRGQEPYCRINLAYGNRTDKELRANLDGVLLQPAETAVSNKTISPFLLIENIFLLSHHYWVSWHQDQRHLYITLKS